MDWWNELDTAMKVLYILASTSTLILALQLILSLFGIGGGADAEAGGFGDISELSDGFSADSGGTDGFDGVYDGDGIPDQGGVTGFDTPGLRIFSMRGILSFFAIGGWTAIVLLKTELNSYLALGIALAVGIATMLIIAKLMQASMRIQSNGNIYIRNAIGATGSVYLSVPPQGNGRGKVSVIVQERLREYDAITYGDDKLPTGSAVRVTDVIPPDTLVVEKLQ